ncbi:MAG TPA: hypothetical protein PLQ19_05030 [Aeromicrobium sp.]|nr:hypothetical protein [Aeromicrobium sp.]
MFVALRDLRFAKGRFALMVAVIVMVAFLVGFLAALTSGLARESTSAITELPADRIAFSTPDGAAADFTSSTVSAQQVKAWADLDSVRSAEPLGVATTRISASGQTVAATAMGVEAGSALVPTAVPAEGQAVLSKGLADKLPGVRVLEIGGRSFEVAAVADTELSFAHTPVLWMSLSDWRAIGLADSSSSDIATVVAITGDPAKSVPQMTAMTLSDSRSAIGSFSSENGSLLTITGFLVAISALVVSAFFSVWTVNRTADIAVLKALGASGSYLVRDAIGQAALVLVGSVAVGTALAWLAALVAGSFLPVVAGATTLLVPGVILILAGLVGAAGAVWRITRIDPHAALAAR